MSKLSRIKTKLNFNAGIFCDSVNNHLLCLMLVVLFSLPGSFSLRILEARIPVYKLRGEDAELSCTYDLEKDTLYSVKWYKDDEEFYRYMPASNPIQQLFKRPGVRVHHSKSNASHVVLTQLDFSSSGLYRCEISVESLFNTLNRFGRLLVVELPNEGPRITGVKDKYEYGEYLKANCSSSRSHPAAQLSWEINKQKVLPKHTYSHPPIRHPDGLESSKLELMVQMDEHHFVKGAMRLRCVATVAAIYTSSEQDYLEEDRLVNKPIVLEQRDHLISVNGAVLTRAGGVWLPFGVLQNFLIFGFLFQYLIKIL